MTLRSTAVRVVVLGLSAVSAALIAACGNDSGASDSSAPSAANSTAATSASATPQAPAGFDAAAAQQILRAVVDPATPPERSAALVDSSDPQIGQKLSGFARGASAGGYSPDVFTVTSVAADGPDAATASVSVASPHAPAPVTVPYGFAKVGDTWKLSSKATQDLLSFANGPR